MSWVPEPAYVLAVSAVPWRRCRFCTGSWWWLSHCCRRGLALEDYGARLRAALFAEGETK